MEADTISCKIILEQPVAGITYGLQSGSGHSYEVLQKQVAQPGELIFEFALPVKRSKEGSLVLHGPIIQGPPESRFLYLDIGGYAGQENAPISGRLKVPLPKSPDDLIRATRNGGSFVTKIPGRNAKDGAPTMGTIKPFDGWKLS